MSVQKMRRIVNRLAIVVLALSLLWPVGLALATVGTTYLYQWQELQCVGGVTCPNWVQVSQLGVGDVTLAEGESLAHAFKTTGLTEGQTYYFVIDSYLYKNETCGFDRLVQYDYTSRLTYTKLPGDPGTPIANGSLETYAGGVGDMYTSGVQAGSVTVGARQVSAADANIISSYWPVRFTASSSTVYFYFALELAQPDAYDPPPINGIDQAMCTVGASRWDGNSLEANISDDLTRIQAFFPSATADRVLKKDGPRKVTPSAVLTTVIEGRKWYDLDVSGTIGADEPGVTGWTVRLYGCLTSACATRTLLNTTATLMGGGWFYSGTSSGILSNYAYYQVCEVLPATGNWFTSYPTMWGTAPGEYCHTPVPVGTATPLPYELSFGNFQADWGDLPDGTSFGQTGYTWTSDYKTLRSEGGPYHIPYPNADRSATAAPLTLSTNGDPAIWLGTTGGVGLIDRETDGMPSATATGDDANQNDDEDGIVLGNLPANKSLTATFSSSSTAGGSGCLVVWFDWDHDGAFATTSFPSTPGASEMAVKADVSWTGTTHTQTFGFIVPFCEPDPYNCVPGKAALDAPLFYRARLFDSACPAVPSPTGQAINGEVEDYRFDISPTAIDLLYFEAAGDNKTIVLSWATEREVDNVGFNLYRAEAIDGERVKINAELIPSNVEPGSPFGAVYEYPDSDKLKNKQVYYYWLEDVDIYGGTELHGPAEASLTKGPQSAPPLAMGLSEG